jgi:hypothetical protein
LVEHWAKFMANEHDYDPPVYYDAHNIPEEDFEMEQKFDEADREGICGFCFVVGNRRIPLVKNRCPKCG